MELTSKETDLAKFWEIWVSGASVNLCSLFVLSWTLYFQQLRVDFVVCSAICFELRFVFARTHARFVNKACAYTQLFMKTKLSQTKFSVGKIKELN